MFTDKVAARGQSSELSPISGKSLQVKCEKQSNEAIASKVRHDGVTGKSMMSSISEPQTASSQQQPIRHHPCSTPNSKLSSSVVLPSSSSVGLTSQCSGAKRPGKRSFGRVRALRIFGRCLQMCCCPALPCGWRAWCWGDASSQNRS